MRKTIALIPLLFILSASLYSQAIQYEIKIKHNKDATADISVIIKAGEPSFTYFLMTNDPMKGEILQKTNPIRNKTYVFKDVKPGKYFIRIEDKMGLPAGKTIEIKEN